MSTFIEKAKELIIDRQEKEDEFNLSRQACIDVLKIDDKINSSPIKLFKKDTILLYVGRCRGIGGGLVVTSKAEKWIGKKDIYERHFGYIVDFIIKKEGLEVVPKIGDVAWVDPFNGEFLPLQIGNELLYFKVIKLDEINVIIK